MSVRRAQPTASEAPTQAGPLDAEPSIVTMPGSQVRALRRGPRPLGVWLLLVVGLMGFGAWRWLSTDPEPPRASPRAPALAPAPMGSSPSDGAEGRAPASERAVGAQPASARSAAPRPSQPSLTESDPPAAAPAGPDPDAPARGQRQAAPEDRPVGRRGSRMERRTASSAHEDPGLARLRSVVGAALAEPQAPARFEAALAALRRHGASLPPERARALEAAVRRAEFSWAAEDLERALQSAVAATTP